MPGGGTQLATPIGAVPNRVKGLYTQGQSAFGTYILLPAPACVEIAAISGFDFVRIDAYHTAVNPETLQAMVTTAYAYNLTPWVRCHNDPFTIMNVLDLGVQMISIPNMPDAEAARAAVNSAFYPPRGQREMNRATRFRGHTAPQYLDWVNENVVVSCQIEDADGIANYREIVKVEGLDCIQAGRGDISLAIGLAGQEFHPKVLELEERIVMAALEAGKQVSLVHPLTDDGIERTLRWMERGVRILTLDGDERVLQRSYTDGLPRVKRARAS
jgi:2-keto-3-deoxy-L-rhamnonate aldolase RhmA